MASRTANRQNSLDFSTGFYYSTLTKCLGKTAGGRASHSKRKLRAGLVLRSSGKLPDK
jgi:hypothetical protein